MSFFAAREGFHNILKFIRNQGSSLLDKSPIEDSLLHEAARGGWYQACQFLVDEGLDVMSRNLLLETPCMIAALEANYNVLELFSETPDFDPK